MIPIFLIVVIVVMTVLILLASIYILVYFQAEEDRNTAWMPKIAVVLGLTLASLVVLLPPLDVANRGSGGELDVSLLYQVMFVSIAVWVVVIIPFLIFYYEAEDPESPRGQLCWAVVYETVTLACATTVLVIMWIFLGRAQIPVTQYVYDGPLLDAAALTPAAGCGLDSGCVEGENSFYEIGVTPIVYIMALSSFVGWFFLALFGGIGMAALPLDLMLAYKSRPQCISLQDYAKQRVMLHERAQRLRSIGQALGLDAANERKRKARVAYNKYKQAVYFLEQDWAKVRIAYKHRGGNPLRYIADITTPSKAPAASCHGAVIPLFRFSSSPRISALPRRYIAMTILGVLCLVISLVWIAHLVLYVLVKPPVTPFLNDLFIALDSVFPLFGTLSYGIFAFYLLFCVLKGCLKFGLRCFCMSIHPMRIGNTMMNSMLFNVWMLLLTAVAIVQFSSSAFSTYARLTAVDMLFGIQVENLIFLRYIYVHDAFEWTLLGLSVLSGLYLACRPRERRALELQLDDELELEELRT